MSGTLLGQVAESEDILLFPAEPGHVLGNPESPGDSPRSALSLR